VIEAEIAIIRAKVRCILLTSCLKRNIFENVALEMFGGSGMAGDHNLFASGQ
jgi:hypothetical protein